MEIEKILQKDVQDFIHGHKSVDIRVLSLQKLPFDGVLRTQILQQIQSRQKAVGKLNKWIKHKEIIFPSPDLVEQSSSDITSSYKASLFPQAEMLIDLTAGLGSDFLAISEKFSSGYCVDADPVHAKLLEYNLSILSNKKLKVTNDYAENFIKTMPNVDLVYIDPQRRNEAGKRGIYDFSQMKPDILEILPILRKKSAQILIKTSPFLDIREAISQLGFVHEVHVVESQGQCKEVLYLIKTSETENKTSVTTANCDKTQTYSYELEELTKVTPTISTPLTYLYEPCAALMKSGLHTAYGVELNLMKLSNMTHLYTSDHLIKDFMGRSFEIKDVLPVKKQALARELTEKQANITTRNFPMKPEELRKKFGLKDGGPYTIFGCTLQNGEKRLILCQSATH